MKVNNPIAFCARAESGLGFEAGGGSGDEVVQRQIRCTLELASTYK